MTAKNTDQDRYLIVQGFGKDTFTNCILRGPFNSFEDAYAYGKKYLIATPIHPDFDVWHVATMHDYNMANDIGCKWAGWEH